MALSDYMEAFSMQNWISEPDGLGGILWKWEDGVQFEAGLVLNTSTEMQIAHQSGTRNVYSLTCQARIQFEPGDVIKRLKDEAMFRITSYSADKTAPPRSSIQVTEVSCERVEV